MQTLSNPSFRGPDADAPAAGSGLAAGPADAGLTDRRHPGTVIIAERDGSRSKPSTSSRSCRPAARLIGNRYPFANSTTDVQLADFATVFGYGGLFDKFFVDHLEKQVDTSGAVWTWRPGPWTCRARLLDQFQAARRVRDMFFPSGSKTPDVKFFVTSATSTATRTRFVLEIDGQTLDDKQREAAGVVAGAACPARPTSAFEGRFFDPPQALRWAVGLVPHDRRQPGRRPGSRSSAFG